ncbi:MAG: DsbC family protein [Proteobacteria bacterium]|nr:DsbC family protein [Pseudomonadota bacterium]
MSPFVSTPARLAAILVSSCWAIANAADTDSQLEQVRTKVSHMFDAIEPEHVNTSPIDGWYTVQKGSIVAYISADGRYLLQGDLIDLDLQVNLSEESRTHARRELIASLEDGQSILFSPAETRHTVTVFTDIDCSYCRKLHSQIDQYLERGIAVRYLLYPRNGPASRAWSASEDVWCSRDRNNALTMAKLDRDFQTSKCDASAVSRHYVLGQDVGLSGTPAIVLEDGTLIGGYVSPAQLKARLDAAALN